MRKWNENYMQHDEVSKMDAIFCIVQFISKCALLHCCAISMGKRARKMFDLKIEQFNAFVEAKLHEKN